MFVINYTINLKQLNKEVVYQSVVFGTIRQIIGDKSGRLVGNNYLAHYLKYLKSVL